MSRAHSLLVDSTVVEVHRSSWPLADILLQLVSVLSSLERFGPALDFSAEYYEAAKEVFQPNSLNLIVAAIQHSRLVRWGREMRPPSSLSISEQIESLERLGDLIKLSKLVVRGATVVFGGPWAVLVKETLASLLRLEDEMRERAAVFMKINESFD